MPMNILETIHTRFAQGKKGIAILIDPDKQEKLEELVSFIRYAELDYILVGSSFLLKEGLESCIKFIKEHSNLPVILFPGNTFQLSSRADGILFLSLISGRNPDLLIGKQVEAAPWIKNSKIECIPTGYMLIDGGNLTGASYISQTIPIPRNQEDIAVSTAAAGELLGMKLIYMDAGSGAKQSVPLEMIKKVRSSCNLPLIVGGGIKSAEQAEDILRNGADIIVVGNGAESEPGIILELSQVVHKEKWIAG